MRNFSHTNGYIYSNFKGNASSHRWCLTKNPNCHLSSTGRTGKNNLISEITFLYGMLRTPRSASILTWSIVAQLVPASNRSTRTWVDCHQKRKEDRIGRHLWISSLRLKTREALSHGKNIKFTKSESSKRPSWVFAKFKLSLSIQHRAEAFGRYGTIRS